jgi:uncharacterized membrane protein
MATDDPSLVDRLAPDAPQEYVGLVYALVLLWGLGDVLSTYFAYAAVGTSAAETNPWMAMLLSYNPVLVAVIKGAVVLSVGVVLLTYREVVQRVPGWRLWLSAVVVLGVFVVLNNLAVGVIALALTAPVSSRQPASPADGRPAFPPRR